MRQHLMRRYGEKVAVYAGAALLLAGLLLAARAYAAYAQASLKETREASASGAVAGETRPPVKTFEVFTMKMTDTLRLPGSVEASQDIDLASRAEGTIEWIGVDEGDRVSEGQPLLRLETDILEAQLARQETAMRLARLRYERIKNLYERGVESKDSFDDASAALEEAEASVREARENLAWASLSAPTDGVVDRRHVDEGEHVAIGQTVFKIVNIDKVEVWCDIPEKDVNYFEAGETARVVFSNGMDYSFDGDIVFVARSAMEASRTYPLKIMVDNDGNTLRPGMITRVELVRDVVEEAVAVPMFSMVDREDGKVVYVVEDGVARERPVRFGVFQGGLVEIVDGLKPGDDLVVIGQRNLVDGQRVEVVRDLTPVAKRMVAEGRDLATLALEAHR